MSLIADIVDTTLPQLQPRFPLPARARDRVVRRALQALPARPSKEDVFDVLTRLIKREQARAERKHFYGR